MIWESSNSSEGDHMRKRYFIQRNHQNDNLQVVESSVPEREQTMEEEMKWECHIHNPVVLGQWCKLISQRKCPETVCKAYNLSQNVYKDQWQQAGQSASSSLTVPHWVVPPSLRTLLQGGNASIPWSILSKRVGLMRDTYNLQGPQLCTRNHNEEDL